MARHVLDPSKLKRQDFDDWKISPALFAMVDAMWGPHVVNCFAHVDNAKLPTFYSTAVDAFTVNWAGQINWWVPPVHLAELVVPAWKSASFCHCSAQMGTIRSPMYLHAF